VLKELAFYHMPAFLELLKSFCSSKPQQALEIGEWLLYAEAPTLGAAAAEVLAETLSDCDQWRAYLLLALCKYGVDDYYGASECLRKFDTEIHVRAVTLTGDIAVARGVLANAEIAYSKVLTLNCEEYAEGRGHALRGLGYIFFRRGRMDEAEEKSREALRDLEQFGDSVNHAETLGDLGEILAAKGAFEDSLNMLESSLQMNRRMGRVGGVGIVEGLMAVVDFKLGDYRRAEERLDRAMELVRHASYRWRQVWLLDRMAELKEAEGFVDQAVLIRQQARELYDLVSLEEPVT
jgi:tetratricopeptide (TPR) repeat protein